MDIKREGIREQKRRKRILYSVIGLLILGFLTVGLLRLEPAAPKVDSATVYTDEVKRGEMLRQVRGPGTLVPIEIRWIAARTDARVERKVVLPGAEVTRDTVVLELSNPELEQSTEDAELALRAAEAQFANLKVELDRQLLNDRAAAAAIESEFKQAELQARADQTLMEQGLKPELEAQLSALRAEELRNRNEIENERLATSARSVEAQIRSEEARLAQARALYTLRRSQLDGLQVRAGIDGVLQEVPLEVGQQVTPGTNLARVAQPDKLRAELRINETQAKDVALGQKAMIDTRNGIVEGRVERIDPAVQNGTVLVDVTLLGELPLGARPDLSVDGTVEIERLPDVLYVGRPAYGQADSTMGLFKVGQDGIAERVRVRLGRTSVTTVEIVEGLKEGDVVVLSDTAKFDKYDRIRLN